jgi:putative ABC transport system permease protein
LHISSTVLAGLSQDVRFGLRTLVRQPGLSAAAVLTLALGIGALSSLAAVVKSVLLEPLVYPGSSELVEVWEARPRMGRVRGHVSPADFIDWRAQNRSFQSMAAYFQKQINVGGSGIEPLRVEAALVSGDFFRVLRANPALGRPVEPGDDDSGAPAVAVLADSLARRLFESPGAALGSTVRVDGVARRIVGVLPPGFRSPGSRSAIFLPLALGAEETNERAVHYLRVVARLRAGVDVEEALEEMRVVSAALEARHEVNRGHQATVFPLKEEIVREIRPALRLLAIAVSLVLALVCANVANLLLVRASGRTRELRVRVSLGAGRARLLRQLLTESLLLALAGGISGTVLASWSVDVLRGLPQEVLPRANEIALDARTLLFVLAATVSTGLAFGIAPAFQALRLSRGIEGMGKRALAPGGAALRDALVISQAALALILTVGAALLGRSLVRLLEVDPGFVGERLLTAELSLPEARYPDDPARDAFFRALNERLQSIEGVVSASTVTAAPLRGPSGSRYFQIENAEETAPGEGRNAAFHLVSPGYFETMGIPLLRGRDFNGADDRTNAAVAIVTETMALRYWGHEDPLGARIRVGEDPWRTIVGVVGSVRQSALHEPPEPEMYWPQLQASYPLATVVLRTERDPLSILPAVRDAVSSIDRDLPLGRIATGSDLVAATLARRRLPLALVSLFAACAVALAAVGLAGVLSCGVAFRTREIGLRLALGAERREILRMILKQGLRLSGWGVALGIAGSLVFGPFVSHLLYGVKPTDLASLVGVSLLLVAVCLAAGYLPARRATRIEPIAALRED